MTLALPSGRYGNGCGSHRSGHWRPRGVADSGPSPLTLAARAIHLDPPIVPRSLAIELVDDDPEGPARWHVASRVCRARSDIPLGEVVHHRERAAVFDARAAVDDQVGKQRAPVVLLGLEGERDSW